MVLTISTYVNLKVYGTESINNTVVKLTVSSWILHFCEILVYKKKK